MLEKTLESPLDCKEIQPVHSEGDQPWDFFGRNDAKAEILVLWPPHAKSWLIGKESDAGRDWGQEEKGTTEDEIAGWHHWLHGRESEWTPGVGDRQGGLAGCDSCGHKESDTTELLNWTELIRGKNITGHGIYSLEETRAHRWKKSLGEGPKETMRAHWKDHRGKHQGLVWVYQLHPHDNPVWCSYYKLIF